MPKRYASVPMSLADACLVRLAAQRRLARDVAWLALAPLVEPEGIVGTRRSFAVAFAPLFSAHYAHAFAFRGRRVHAVEVHGTSSRGCGVARPIFCRRPLTAPEPTCRPMPSRFAEPTQTMSLEGSLPWPQPPFVSRPAWPDEVESATPVVIETLRGFEVDGQMLAFDSERQSLIFRLDADGAAVRVPFARVRRLTLTTPLADEAALGSFASHLRKYRVDLGTGASLTGRSAGHVENGSGLFLFTPDEDENTLFRCFVPAGAYLRCLMGPSVEEEAAQRWISRPQQLVEAIDTGTLRRKVLAIGEALYDLGIVSARQITATLERQSGESRVPLGEMLANAGLITRADLRTALGHKMGYPMVDLRAFALDPAALRVVPLNLAFEHGVLPLLLHRQHIVVAMDNLAGVSQLGGLPGTAGMKIAPVLARRQHIEAALLRAYHDHGEQAWATTRNTWGATEMAPA